MNKQSWKRPWVIAGLLVLALLGTATTGCDRSTVPDAGNGTTSETVNGTFVDVDGLLVAPTKIAASYSTEELNLGNDNGAGWPQFLDGAIYTFAYRENSEDQWMTAWDQTTGTKLWSVRTDQYYPLVSDEKRLFLSDSCLDKATGTSPRTGLVGYGNNTLFPTEDNDCINFGSQVVWFGFGGINDSTHINSHGAPMVTTGGTLWYQVLSTWTTLVSQDPYSFLPMINNNYYYDLAGVQGWWYGSLGGIAPGDIVVRTQSYWHAMPVSAVVDKHSTPWTTELDEIYISSHTDPAYDTRLIDFMPSIIGHPEYCTFVNINLYKMP